MKFKTVKGFKAKRPPKTSRDQYWEMHVPGVFEGTPLFLPPNHHNEYGGTVSAAKTRSFPWKITLFKMEYPQELYVLYGQWYDKRSQNGQAYVVASEMDDADEHDEVIYNFWDGEWRSRWNTITPNIRVLDRKMGNKWHEKSAMRNAKILMEVGKVGVSDLSGEWKWWIG